MRIYAALKKFVVAVIFALVACGALTIKINEIFECDKQKEVCEYKYNTFVNRAYQVEKVYPLKDINEVKYEFYQTRSINKKGKEKIKDHHTIVFDTSKGEYPFPIEFSDANDAKVEAAFLGKYLANDENTYKYNSGISQIFVAIIMLLAVLGAVYFGRRGWQVIRADKASNQ